MLEDAGRLLLLVAAAALVAGEHRNRQPAENAVPARAGERRAALREPLGVLALILPVEDRARELPGGVRGEAGGQQDQERLAERLLGDRAQRAVLVRALLAATQRNLDREDPDDDVEDALRDEADPAQALDPRALARAVSLRCDRPRAHRDVVPVRTFPMRARQSTIVSAIGVRARVRS